MGYAIPKNAEYLGDVIDERAGDYFVSAADNGQFWLLAGPYPTHRAALDMVETVRRIAIDNDSDGRAVWMAYGTCRMNEGSGHLGVCQRLGVLPEAAEELAAA